MCSSRRPNYNEIWVSPKMGVFPFGALPQTLDLEKCHGTSIVAKCYQLSKEPKPNFKVQTDVKISLIGATAMVKCGQSLTKVDTQCDKLVTIVGQTMLTIFVTVDV